MSNSIEITCPCCTYSRSAPLEKVPPNAVTVTCPKCYSEFCFEAHVKALEPQTEVSEISTQQFADSGNPDTKASPACSEAGGSRLIDSPFFALIVPVVICVALYALGEPLYVSVAVLLGAQYWFGPILVYFKQRMPTHQPLRPVPSDTGLPPEHGAFLNRTIPVLEAAGFVSKGCCTNAPQDAPVAGVVALMQNETTSDVAHLLVVVNNRMVGQTIGFSRSRTDGSRIRTSWSNIPSPFPPVPGDNSLKIGGEIEPADLWSVHQARVAADTMVAREEPIFDAIGYQRNEERQGVETKLASGWWQQAGQQGFIRPTLPGAFLMCLRMLFPWKQLAGIHSRMEVRRHLREAN